MNKKINWKHIAIATLTVSNLFLIVNAKQAQPDSAPVVNQAYKLELENEGLKNELSYWIDEALAQDWIIHDLKDELVSLDEEAAGYYSLYKEALNNLYMLEVETDYYNENTTDPTRNPMTLEQRLIDNHNNGNY